MTEPDDEWFHKKAIRAASLVSALLDDGKKEEALVWAQLSTTYALMSQTDLLRAYLADKRHHLRRKP